jgi:hypothetical protein
MVRSACGAGIAERPAPAGPLRVELRSLHRLNRYPPPPRMQTASSTELCLASMARTRTVAAAARRLKVTRKLHRHFLVLHISETSEGPPSGWSGLSTWGRGIQGLHPVPELTGEVCLSIAARSELRASRAWPVPAVPPPQAAHDAQGPYPRDGIACRLYGPTLRAERPHPQAVRAADSGTVGIYAH